MGAASGSTGRGTLYGDHAHMSIKSMAQGALATIATVVPGSAVTVKYKGTSGTGVRDSRDAAAAAGIFGEEGLQTGTVRVSSASFTTEPERGAAIVVAGEQAQILNVRRDPVGALWTVDYQETRQVEGI